MSRLCPERRMHTLNTAVALSTTAVAGVHAPRLTVKHRWKPRIRKLGTAISQSDISQTTLSERKVIRRLEAKSGVMVATTAKHVIDIRKALSTARRLESCQELGCR